MKHELAKRPGLAMMPSAPAAKTVLLLVQDALQLGGRKVSVGSIALVVQLGELVQPR